MADDDNNKLSSGRLRVGVVLFILWWLPVYLVIPVAVDALGATTPQSRRQIAITVLLVQTMVGIAGLLLVGKQIALLLRHTSPKKLPKTIWHMFWSGQVGP